MRFKRIQVSSLEFIRTLDSEQFTDWAKKDEAFWSKVKNKGPPLKIGMWLSKPACKPIQGK